MRFYLHYGFYYIQTADLQSKAVFASGPTKIENHRNQKPQATQKLAFLQVNLYFQDHLLGIK